jgi:hypothetical protein
MALHQIVAQIVTFTDNNPQQFCTQHIFTLHAKSNSQVEVRMELHHGTCTEERIRELTGTSGKHLTYTNLCWAAFAKGDESWTDQIQRIQDSMPDELARRNLLIDPDEPTWFTNHVGTHVLSQETRIILKGHPAASISTHHF